jgi:methylated-DNA-[protein]-cysteine S-methyltransferase
MQCYQSPLGKILMVAESQVLTGLWFEGGRYLAARFDKEYKEKPLPIFRQVSEWLDIYFSGKKPDFDIPLHLTGSDFQQEVTEVMRTIPYGETMTYGDIARQVAKKRRIPFMSAQAVGGAVGRNEISIIVPCHRVIGTNGNLTGYGAGIERKIELLRLENGFKEYFFVPKSPCNRRGVPQCECSRGQKRR